MSDEVLSQEEINALMGETTSNDKNKKVENKCSEVDDSSKDIIGEVGNISMSTAATTLSSILNHQVTITTPRVSCISLKEVIDQCKIPKVVTSIKFTEGLTGDNLLMMDVKDSMVIADLMMGGDGKKTEGEFTEIELSAVGEAMNQMIGSASTSMATMLDKSIDIEPPRVDVWDRAEDIKFETLNLDVEMNSFILQVAFDLSVPGLIESEIMQIFTLGTVEEIVDIMMGDMSNPVEKEKVVEKAAARLEKSLEKQENMDNVNLNEPRVVSGDDSGITHVQAANTVEVKKPVFQELDIVSSLDSVPRNLDLIMDVPLEFSVVLGKTKKSIKEILDFTSGSIVELDKLADEPLEIYVNGKLIAQGEVVVINENFGIRITNILTKEERVRNLG